MDWIISPFQPVLRGKIVEIGIGHGSYCQILSRQNEYIGIDIDELSVQRALERFPGKRFAVCDILDEAALQDTVPEGADAILAINVLEHIADDAAAVKNLVGLLRPGGHICIAVPALQMLYNDLDRLAGHYRRYNLSQIGEILRLRSVEVVRLSYFNPIGGFGWWLNSLKSHNSLNSNLMNNQIRAFERYVLPFSKMLDPLSRKFFGQSVIGIGRRI